MARRDTRLESEGAEFLVLGTLLIEKIPAYKTYTRMPGYDLVATNPAKGSSVRIQVKSRWRKGANAFALKNFDCEFVVFVALNKTADEGRSSGKVEQYIFPIEMLREVHKKDLGWKRGGVLLSTIPHREGYRNDWSLIRRALKL